MNPEKKRKIYPKIQEFLDPLEKYLKRYDSVPKTEKNINRAILQKRCRNFAKMASAVFSLTAGTGMGKTIDALLWGILRAVASGMDRIIFVYPQLSILSQAAGQFKEIFGDENVLEHDSDTIYNYAIDCSQDDVCGIEDNYKALAVENWDAPIILTTYPQFLESMHSSMPSKLRKLHNIANSVVIMDEVQELPYDRLEPIVYGLKSFVNHFGVSLLMTTATPPILSGTIKGSGIESVLHGFDSIQEIGINCENYSKVKVAIREEALEYDEVANEILSRDQALCVVNTRKDAREIFNRIRNEEGTFHLSKNMCPVHVKAVLDAILESLRNGKKTRVVSTQIVEAGVDVDFPFVMRQEAGTSSLGQTKGRCNREGKFKDALFVIFKIKGRRVPPGFMSICNEARLTMQARLTKNGFFNPEDMFAPENMAEYFKVLANKTKTFDKPNHEGYGMTDLECGATFEELRLASANKHFKIIDDDKVSVFVPKFDAVSESIYEEYKKYNMSRELQRKMLRYCVSVSRSDYNKMLAYDIVRVDSRGLAIVESGNQYDSKCGMLSVDDNRLSESII